MMGPQLWNFNIFHLLLLLFLSKFTTLCSISIAAADPAAITPNQSITDGRVLVSPGGKFALGFFRPGASNRRYVGIWYNKVSEQTVVWVANRNNPLNDTSGVVSLNSAGNLILTTAKHNASPVWSTNISTNSTVPVEARLLDSGNLAVIQEGTEKVLWQSFDYPTDTLMPFMKLGLDRRTGLNRVLTSWKSPDNPGTGSCSYGIDPTGTPQVFLDKGSERRWRAGPWNGQRLSGVPAMTNNYIFNVSYVDGPDENFIVYGIMNPSIISRMVLSESGSVERFTWHEADRRWIEFWSAPKDSCDYYRQCGAFGYCDPNPNSGEFECKCLPGFKPKSAQDWYLRDGSGGCVRERGPDSVCGKGEGFVRLARAKVPDTRAARADMGVTGQACEEKCLKNCTCVAYTSANVSGGGSGSGCLAWYGDLVDTQVYSSEGQDLYVRVDAVVLENARKGSKGFHGAKRTLVLTIMPIALVGLILITVRFCWHGRLSWLRGHSRSQSQKMSLLNLASPYKSNVDGNESEGNNGKINLPFYSLREIKSATDNFSNKLGEGGFGAVYKGHLSNGQVIAVKRLAKQSGQGAEEFKNEVLLIAKLQHRNLVKILGYCIDEEETMLIYEYMLNKSLDSFIFDQSRKAMLDWERRYEIIIGIARGILYLHQDSRLRIVHRDLKTSNILLDGEMNPKISDFGMARIFGGNQTQANTNRVVGTFGYMSPEYALDGLFSMKSDVFSFGVLLLEIISGTKNLALYTDDPLSNLIRYTWDLWREGKALDVVDASLGDSWPKSDVIRCIHVGLLCVQENAVDRPTMSTVVFTLSNEATLPPPKQPPFAIRRSGKDTVGSTASGSTSCSKNEVTITEIEPR